MHECCLSKVRGTAIRMAERRCCVTKRHVVVNKEQRFPSNENCVALEFEQFSHLADPTLGGASCVC